ncbi:MAG: M28 family peptidase [Anaerolineae bacterium]|nr:M28 family peptidase [Anaerolineae bacterium]
MRTKSNRLPGWVPPVIILAGVTLLSAGIIVFLTSRPEYSVAAIPATPTPTQAAVPTPTQTPMPAIAASLNSPPPTPVTASPLPTPITTLPLPTPAASEPTLVSTVAATSDSALIFDGDTAYQYVLGQTALGPRPTGSEAGWATGDYIIAALEQQGWAVETQEFLFMGVKGRNIVGKRGSGPIIILGAHYDTRPAADKDPDPARQSEWIEGANDGASGVAVLLELARVLEADQLKNEVWLTFFDAEDRGNLDGWPYSVGARHMAGNLTANPQSMVLVDMVGDADQNIFFEKNSNELLSQEIWAIAAELGYQAQFIPQPKYAMIDDHVPFLERGIPAVDIIDFDFPYHHTTADTADKVAPASLERVGRTLEVWLEEKQ